jgi:hypothetical protein
MRKGLAKDQRKPMKVVVARGSNKGIKGRPKGVKGESHGFSGSVTVLWLGPGRS